MNKLLYITHTQRASASSQQLSLLLAPLRAEQWGASHQVVCARSPVQNGTPLGRARAVVCTIAIQHYANGNIIHVASLCAGVA